MSNCWSTQKRSWLEEQISPIRSYSTAKLGRGTSTNRCQAIIILTQMILKSWLCSGNKLNMLDCIRNHSSLALRRCSITRDTKLLSRISYRIQTTRSMSPGVRRRCIFGAVKQEKGSGHRKLWILRRPILRLQRLLSRTDSGSIFCLQRISRFSS